MNFQIVPAASGKKLFVKIEGDIVENAQFNLLNLDGRMELHIDARGIDYINSAGISRWIDWTRELKSKYPVVTFFLNEVPYSFLKQAITVEGFLPPGSGVLSTVLPFVCDDCLDATEKLFTRGKDYPADASADDLKSVLSKPIPCECGAKHDLDANLTIITLALQKFSPKPQ